ncbi:MAG: hypothetical protein OXH52_12745 [Gammaproteobacteria bacterium]|nr:hypothetical protein [Gammaproteobacteria bacterium]
MLHLMEDQGLLRIDETSRGAFAIKLEDKEPPVRGPTTASGDSRSMSNQLLRSEVWRAFVMEEPPGRRFLNKESAEVLAGLQEPPSPSEDWIELAPVPAETQRDWAKEFLGELGLMSNSKILDSLVADDWYRTFRLALGEHSPALVAEWNRRRSSLVTQQVRQWCNENGLSHTIAFRNRVRIERLPPSHPLLGSNLQWDEAALRSIVIKAFEGAPIEWLLDVSIPSKYILRALMGRSAQS